MDEENKDPLAVLNLAGALIRSTVTTGNDMQFNACVGDNTGTNENSIGYAGGFEKAAEVLLASLGIGKPGAAADSWGGEPLVDLLVYPICYCARHHVELTLKRLLPKAWHAYRTRFSRNQKQLEAPKDKGARHNLMAVWSDLVTVCSAVDERLAKLCLKLEPYIDDLNFVDATGQVFRYDRDIKTFKLHMEKVRHIDLTHFATGYAQMCVILNDMEVEMSVVLSDVASGSFTTKLNRDELIEIATVLPNRSEWGGSEFVAARARIKARFSLSSNDFQRATKIILGSRWLSYRVGVELPIADLSADVLERLHRGGAGDKDALASLTEQERSALYGVLESASPFAYPEGFDACTVARPTDREEGLSFDLAREPDYLARKYSRMPDRIETALRKLGQIELLSHFQQIYREEIGSLRVMRAAHSSIDFNKLFFRPPSDGEGEVA